MGDAWIAQAGDPGKAAMTPAQEAEALRAAAQGQSGVRIWRSTLGFPCLLLPPLQESSEW